MIFSAHVLPAFRSSRPVVLLLLLWLVLLLLTAIASATSAIYGLCYVTFAASATAAFATAATASAANASATAASATAAMNYCLKNANIMAHSRIHTSVSCFSLAFRCWRPVGNFGGY